MPEQGGPVVDAVAAADGVDVEQSDHRAVVDEQLRLVEVPVHRDGGVLAGIGRGEDGASAPPAGAQVRERRLRARRRGRRRGSARPRSSGGRPSGRRPRRRAGRRARARAPRDRAGRGRRRRAARASARRAGRAARGRRRRCWRARSGPGTGPASTACRSTRPRPTRPGRTDLEEQRAGRRRGLHHRPTPGAVRAQAQPDRAGRQAELGQTRGHAAPPTPPTPARAGQGRRPPPHPDGDGAPVDACPRPTVAPSGMRLPVVATSDSRVSRPSGRVTAAVYRTVASPSGRSVTPVRSSRCSRPPSAGRGPQVAGRRRRAAAGAPAATTRPADGHVGRGHPLTLGQVRAALPEQDDEQSMAQNDDPSPANFVVRTRRSPFGPVRTTGSLAALGPVAGTAAVAVPVVARVAARRRPDRSEPVGAVGAVARPVPERAGRRCRSARRRARRSGRPARTRARRRRPPPARASGTRAASSWTS